MIEVYGYPTAIEALDTAVKAANVSVVDMVKVSGGLVTVTVEGDVGAVQASMEAAQVAAKRIGNVMSVHVIPRPDEGIGGIILAEEKAHTTPVEDGKALPKTAVIKAEAKEAQPKPAVKKVEAKAQPKPAVKKVEAVKAQPKPATKKVAEKKPPEEKVVAKKAGKHTLEELSSMKVVELRVLARELGTTNLTNKEIRFGNKTDLIAAILGGE
jgi:microcompartment protein CcmL/EutN